MPHDPEQVELVEGASPRTTSAAASSGTSSGRVTCAKSAPARPRPRARRPRGSGAGSSAGRRSRRASTAASPSRSPRGGGRPATAPGCRATGTSPPTSCASRPCCGCAMSIHAIAPDRLGDGPREDEQDPPRVREPDAGPLEHERDRDPEHAWKNTEQDHPDDREREERGRGVAAEPEALLEPGEQVAAHVDDLAGDAGRSRTGPAGICPASPPTALADDAALEPVAEVDGAAGP